MNNGSWALIVSLLIVGGLFGIVLSFKLQASSDDEDSEPSPDATVFRAPPGLLHLRSYDILEEDFRDYTRVLLLTPIGASICDGIRGLDAPDVVDVLSSDDPTADAQLPHGAVRRQGQAAWPEDALVAAAILLEECSRIGGD